MEAEAKSEKSLMHLLIITASVLGIVQGLLWFIMSLISVLYYENRITPTSSQYSLIYIDRTLFDLYLNREYTEMKSAYGGIIGPKEFNIYMYLYLVFSFSLLVISLALLWAALPRKFEKHYELELCIIIWTINIIILSLLDVSLLCMLGYDFNRIRRNIPRLVPLIADITVGLVSVCIVMALAARGFVLWIVNVIFVAILGKYLYDLHTNKETNPNQPTLGLYNTPGSSRPPWEMPNSSSASDINRFGPNNIGYGNDNHNPMLNTSSRSFPNLALNDGDNYGRPSIGNDQRGQNLYGNNNSSENNSNNWNSRNQNNNEPYGAGNISSLRPLSPADRWSDIPNHYGQPASLRTAKVGRQGGQRVLPLSVNPPFIPDPDYSPARLPMVKGVLTPKSNYMH